MYNEVILAAKLIIPAEEYYIESEQISRSHYQDMYPYVHCTLCIYEHILLNSVSDVLITPPLVTRVL